MRTLTIRLPDEVAHRLEVCAAKDNERLAEGIERLLTYLVEQFEANRNNQNDRGTKNARPLQ